MTSILSLLSNVCRILIARCSEQVPYNSLFLSLFVRSGFLTATTFFFLVETSCRRRAVVSRCSTEEVENFSNLAIGKRGRDVGGVPRRARFEVAIDWEEGRGPELVLRFAWCVCYETSRSYISSPESSVSYPGTAISTLKFAGKSATT